MTRSGSVYFFCGPELLGIESAMDPKDAIVFFGCSSIALEYLACPSKTQTKRNPPIAVSRDANAQKNRLGAVGQELPRPGHP